MKETVLTTKPIPWKVSLHGGHSQAYCDHAETPLRTMLETAVARGFHTYGLSEHAPRVEDRLLYPEEREMGWDVDTLEDNFDRYAKESTAVVEDFADRLVVLRGFETEAAPASRYVSLMRHYRERYGFDYIVGSVHHIDDELLDRTPEEYAQLVDKHGGIERFATAYYAQVAEMVAALRPEVVAHLDLIRKFAKPYGSLDTPAIRKPVGEALEVVREHDGIIDVNTAGYRKGLGTPYPDGWIVDLARDMGIGFCFGDDSHSARDVGGAIDQARLYLLEHGIRQIVRLERTNGALGRRIVSLEEE